MIQTVNIDVSISEPELKIITLNDSGLAAFDFRRQLVLNVTHAPLLIETTAATKGHQAAARFVPRLACLGSGIRTSAGTRKRARNRCTMAMLSSFLPARTSLTRLAVPRIGIMSARVSPC